MICTKYIVLEYTNNIKDKINACIAQWAFIAQNGMEKAPKSTVFSTIFNNGNLYMTIRQPRIHF